MFWFIAQLAFAGPLCTPIPSVEQPAVTACETQDTYTFDLAGNLFEYPKLEYRAQFRQALENWHREKGLDPSYLVAARIDVFLSVPDSNPQGTQARFQITAPDHIRYVVSTSIHPSEWNFDNGTVAILPDAPYPESFGFKVGSAIAKKGKHIDAEEFESRVLAHGADDVAPLSGPWWTLWMQPFTEQQVADRINHDTTPPVLVDSIALNGIYEWVAWRALVFTF